MDLVQLNKKLISIEKEIDELVKKEKEFLKSKNLTDYEIYVDIGFFIGDYEIVSFKESVKYFSNFNDNQNHNTSKFTNQHHCWLLHRLYDDFLISWEDILKIDYVWFDVVVKNQYKRKII